MWQENKSEDKSRQMSWSGILLGPYMLFIDNTRTFFRLGGFYALLLTAVSMLFNVGYACRFSEAGCAYQTSQLLISLAVSGFIILMFMRRWLKMTIDKSAWSWRFVLLPELPELKLTGISLAFILLNAVALVSMYLLVIREPNPDWRIEIVYFAVVSVGFLVPFALLRFYALFADVSLEEKIPSLRHLWQSGRDKTLKIMMSLLFICLVGIFFQSALNGELLNIENKSVFYIRFFAEYVYNLLVLLITSFFANHCYLQKVYREGLQQND